MRMDVHTKDHSYPIHLERGILNRAAEYVTDANVFLISDDGVPLQWRTILQKQFPNAAMHVIPQGEGSKCFEVLQDILAHMLEEHLSRKDV
ncbi:MAG: hypothetical protein IKG37_01050, partial [Solobacterium sp.]|nr:hypothetical protein [Solobacterium sp.]